MISRAQKSHTNEHAVRGRTTLKDVERFRNGLVRKPFKRSMYEGTFVSEPIELESCIPNERQQQQTTKIFIS